MVLLAAFLLSAFLYLESSASFSVDRQTNRYVNYVKSSHDWAHHQFKYPLQDLAGLPRGKPLKLPKVQYSFTPAAYDHDPETELRRTAVRDAFSQMLGHAKEYAWLFDELTPVTLQGRTTFGGWAATLVDSLDALLIMGFWDEFKLALPAVASLDWANTTESGINVFETTIRHLGLLPSATTSSGERTSLAKGY